MSTTPSVGASGGAHRLMWLLGTTRWSGAFVGQGAGQLAVGLGLGKQCVGLCLERLHGVGTGCEASRRFLERDERDERVRKLGGVATLLPMLPFQGVTISLVRSA